MDSTKTVAHVGLCAGYAGIELGLKRAVANLRSVALCEIEAFAIANLVAKMEAGLMDPAPIWPDLKTFPWGSFCGRVDILTGGYPCQPFSSAGNRAGKADPRHLWPWIADGISVMRPRVCFFENVEGHISLGLSDVVEDLAGMGYRTTWGIFSAAEVGAPHQRKRVFILAHCDSCGGREDFLRSKLRPVGVEQPSGSSRLFGAEGEAGKVTLWPSRPGEQQHGWEPPRVVGCGDLRRQLDDTGSQRHGTHHPVSTGRESIVDAGAMGDTENGTRFREAQRTTGHAARPDEGAANRQIESPLGRNSSRTCSGLDYAELCISGDNRTDELRLLGNGVVPATAEKAFRVLTSELLQNHD